MDQTLNLCLFPRSSARCVRDTSVLLAADLLPGVAGVLLPLGQGVSGLSPALLPSRLGWRVSCHGELTGLRIMGCSGACPAFAHLMPVKPLPSPPVMTTQSVSTHCQMFPAGTVVHD